MLICPNRNVLCRMATSGAGILVVGLLAVGTMPIAHAQPNLADWLSKAIVPVSEIHKAESTVLAVALSDQKDTAKLDGACRQLDAGYRQLRGQMPTPDPKLSVEVQQAIDNFETATEICEDLVEKPNNKDMWQDLQGALVEGEQHLANADAVVVALSSKG